MNEALIEELKELASLVRRGRLFDVQAWLKAVNLMARPPRPKHGSIEERSANASHSNKQNPSSASPTTEQPIKKNEN